MVVVLLVVVTVVGIVSGLGVVGRVVVTFVVDGISDVEAGIVVDPPVHLAYSGQSQACAY